MLISNYHLVIVTVTIKVIKAFDSYDPNTNHIG